jgi:hypothetical protein
MWSDLTSIAIKQECYNYLIVNHYLQWLAQINKR